MSFHISDLDLLHLFATLKDGTSQCSGINMRSVQYPITALTYPQGHNDYRFDEFSGIVGESIRHQKVKFTCVLFSVLPLLYHDKWHSGFTTVNVLT